MGVKLLYFNRSDKTSMPVDCDKLTIYTVIPKTIKTL